MSGLAAAIAFDGGPSSRHTLGILLAAAAHRAPDGLASWHDADAALGLLRHDLFPGSPAGPVASGPSALVFDGRIDNRDDLLRRLSLGAHTAIDDAALALAAFSAWPGRTPAAIEGDFAFVLWNARERRVIAGRDPIGMRPIHWTLHQGCLLFASDVAQLVAVRGVPPPDESAVADLLAGEPAADGRTLFRHIHRIPAGHLLIADADGCRLQAWWTPDPTPDGRRQSDEEWAGECRVHLERAIRARMRARGPIAVFFSGGVDSSAVLTVAHAIARRDGVAPPVPVSLVFSEPESDESQYRAAVVASLGVEVVSVGPQAIAADELRAQASRRLALPDTPADVAGASLYGAAKQSGASVALTGVGADIVLSGSTFAYADLLARGRVVRAMKRFYEDFRTPEAGWTATGLLSAGLWPLLPVGVRTRLREPAARVVGSRRERSWLRLEPTRSTALADPPAGAPHSTWEIVHALTDGWTAYFLETAERAASEKGCVSWHPLLDSAFVRFVLSLPEEQRRRDRLMKFVLRRAVPELVPAVAARRTKGDFSHLVAKAFEQLGGRRFFAALAIAEAGWVDAAKLTERYDRVTRTSVDEERTGRDLPILWSVAATELWYRAAMQRAQGAVPV